MLNIYITSPLRQCGKTFITAGLSATMQSLGYNTCVYKPVQTSGIIKNGFTQSPDFTFIKTVDPYIETFTTYTFKENYEPLIASEIENTPLETELILSEFKKHTSTYDCTIIDGDNGIMSPIKANTLNGNLINKMNVPVLIVTSPSNDSINTTLSAINNAENLNIKIQGVVINNIKEDCDKTLLNSIPRVIEEYTNVQVLGLIENLGKNPAPEDLISSILNGIDIESVFGVKIEKLDFV